MISIRRDPLGDPLVRTWDALVTSAPDTGQLDQQAFAVLSDLHDALDGPPVDPAFLTRLEIELFGMEAQSTAEETAGNPASAHPDSFAW